MSALILFDCDGTLTDSNGVIVEAVVHGFEKYGLIAPRAAVILAALGQSLPIVIALLLQYQGYDKHQHLVEPISQAYKQHYRQLEGGVQLYPNVEKVLAELKARGYQMAVVTGKSKPGLQRVLRQFHLNQYFCTWRTADCCHSKPHPDMVLACMQALNVQACDATLVGDSQADIQMANNAGVKALGVCFDSTHDAAMLKQAGAENIVYDFQALLDVFPVLA
jgi:phosphoglycolate phosphatase